MLVLGIETSCDETSAAVVRDGRTILSNVVSSQVKLHAEHGGVVPELASRQHLLLIEPVVKEALQKAGVSWTDIDSLAVTRGPGLPSALLVGVSTAQGLALALNKPLAGVNHLKAHLLSPFIATDRAIGERFVSLIVSGGHTMLLSGSGPKDYQVLGQTLDDAAGEAFDKGARLLGLGYPGGPAIDREAKKGRRDAIAFPRSMMEEGYAFSFSGLKTSLAQHLRKFPEAPIADVAASFQEAIVQVLVEKTLRAARDFGVKLVTASGGVSCNSRFRELLAE
ncbi:MAG: tRNA (adenosine(37)-N6)-threonylcarbamoyltransferase complex transferase subunit TsaD, partial [Verrucomicrobiae bacterium]|nr:tRNA (adenosine(37)-N6)-threonylcarbamoyltransferase complex transferase subunit TsaD [Verrucomicrobiae bacterium]